jgi:hypothetical protein
MELDYERAKEAFAAQRIGGAELACVYVADRARRASPRRWVEGPRRPPLAAGPGAPEVVRIFAERELHRLPRVVGDALVAWAAGLRRAEVRFALPSPRDVLAMQARGRRCVSLLDDDAVPSGPIAGLPRAGAYGGQGLGFAVHDLCHLEKFGDPAHHVEQVGVFAALERALGDPRWAEAEAALDDAVWREDEDHVLADMNGSAVFLYVVLRNKVKLAVRRAVARARGVTASRGPLDAEEALRYDEATAVLIDALGIAGEARDAAWALTSKHDAEGAAGRLSAWFEARGREALDDRNGLVGYTFAGNASGPLT